MKGERTELWSQERAAKLKHLVLVDKLSYGEAAERLGVTRDSAYAKGRDIGIRNGSGKKNGNDNRERSLSAVVVCRQGRKPGRQGEFGKIMLRSAKTKEMPTFACSSVSVIPKKDPHGKPYTILTVSDRTCRWPIGDEPATMTFCGHQTADGRVYCQPHTQASAAPSQPRERQFTPKAMARMFGG